MAALVVFACDVPCAAVAQTCQRIGNQVYCDNGPLSQQQGNTAPYNNGVTRQDLGNQPYYSTGPSSQQQDKGGGPPQPLGNFNSFNNGKTCQTINYITYCN
jgi:hypothetical protein